MVCILFVHHYCFAFPRHIVPFLSFCIFLEDVFTKFSPVQDTLGQYLLNRDKVQQIWAVQKKHLKCLQDIPGVNLYLETNALKKGDIMLPVYRSARGSSSLESFHLHLARFIPGK